ncbi:MAG: site-2 protease family protein [Planctomycetota bacterium]
MDALLSLLDRLGEIGLIVFGFGLVIFLHELGHFVAARWAGVRVQAFAVGFGPAVLSWRRGMGLRRGSSAEQYQALVYTAQGERGEARERARSALSGQVSPTEYRLNWLPLGGYVKMLGQDDADPSHRSEEPDSYNSVAIWKRMVIISAGVVANLVSAAALFVLVFTLGLETPAAVVGGVAAGSPAAGAEAFPEGSAASGLLAGDRIVGVNGSVPRSFDDARMAVLTADGSRPIEMEIERSGVEGALLYRLTPERSEAGVLEAGIVPAFSTVLTDRVGVEPSLVAAFEEIGLGGVGPGWRLATVDGDEVSLLHEVSSAASAGRGAAVRVGFVSGDGSRIERMIEPVPVVPTVLVPVRGGDAAVVSLLGLSPVMTVGLAAEGSGGYEQGLRTGDVFARLGGYEYPNAAQGIGAVRASAGSVVEAVVLRGGERVALSLEVKRDGTVGFLVGDGGGDGGDGVEGVLLGGPVVAAGASGRTSVRPGSRLISVGGEGVSSLRDAAVILQRLALEGGAFGEVEVELASPIEGVGIERVMLAVPEEARVELAGMAWSMPAALSLRNAPAVFEMETTVLRSTGPVDAVALGLGETKRIMVMTYLTFARLAQGTIAPRVLNGPVGIVHAGSTLVDRGVVWLLFFFALVSVNLAVINFLPIPITDGGHMVFLLWEQVTGKPVSVVVQNVATLAGLVVIVGVFLFVTYHDLSRLLGT